MSETLAYLEKVFSLHPRWESAQILQLRRSSLQIDAAPQPDTVSTPKESIEEVRSQGRAWLRELQSEFYEIPEEQLHKRLLMLSSESFRELHSVVDRLSIASNYRDILKKLSRNPKLDRHMIAVLSELAVLPANDVRQFRELYISLLDSRSRIELAHSTVAYIETNHPALFELERDWFTAIRRIPIPALLDSWWTISAIILAIPFILKALYGMIRPI